MLAERIKKKCRAQDWLSFSDFMQEALYHPSYGYYCKNSPKFGIVGDFITAPSRSPLFSQCIGNYLIDNFKNNDIQNNIIELGAGNGKMACEILTHLKKHHAMPNKYFIYDISPSLKITQQQYLRKQHADFFENIIWFDQTPAEPLDGILIANEVIDSLPVHRFHINQNFEILEQGISLDSNNNLCLQYKTPQTPNLAKAVDNLLKYLESPLPPGYTSEIHLNLLHWFLDLKKIIGRGKMLFIDYGFRRKEFYHWQRYQGTLMCHYQHQAHDNPLIHIGDQDLTAHVDFDFLAEVAQRQNCKVNYFKSQAHFLMEHGLIPLTEQAMQAGNPLDISQQVNMLTAPHEMGELFKIMEVLCT